MLALFSFTPMNKIAIAGRQLMKGNIGNAITAITTKSVSSELIQPARYRNGNLFFGVNGADKAFIWGNFNSSLIAYQQCPIVSAVINRKAQALVNGKKMVMTGEGKTVKEATSEQAKALKSLLKRPNRLQNGKEFMAQGSIYRQIYGYSPILKIVPIGFESDFTKWRLWNIPPWMLQVLDSQDLFWEDKARIFQGIWLTYMGHSINLDPKNIFFIKENQISTGTYLSNNNTANVSLFLPDSKLFPLERPIDNFNSSLNSRGSMIRNKGPQWLLTNDSADTGEAGLFPIDSDDKADLHKDFLQYGIMDGQRKAIITDAKLKLQTVGFDVAQLKLLEGEIQDAKQICDGLNYPPYLLGLVDAKFDNQAIAERSFYTNSIIPDCQSEDEQWGELLGLESLGLRIQTDFSHLPPLQENISEQGKGRMYMNQGILIEWLQDGITWNRWRELLGEDMVPGMDVYYSDLVKSGRILPAATAQAISAAANAASIIQQEQTTSSNNSNTNNGSAN